MGALLYIRFAVSLLYACAAVSYVLLLAGVLKRRRTPKGLLLLAIAAHVLEILARGVEAGTAGGAPFVGSSGFVSVFAWLLAVIYVALETRYKVHSLGAFHVSLVTILQTAGAIFMPATTSIPPIKTGWLVVLHVATTAIAYAALTASFVAAVAFLLLDRQLRLRLHGVLMRGLPNLGLVESVNVAAVRIGLSFLTAGSLFGIAVGYTALGAEYRWDIKSYFTFAVIAIYAVQLLLRSFAGVTGRRSIVLSCVGFAAMLSGVAVVSQLYSSMHGLT